LSSDSGSRRRLARSLGASALFVFAIACIAARNGNELAVTWFYDIAWWSYIACVDALVYLRRGSSLFFSRRRAFLLLAIWSAAFWLFFEVVNFRLQNWYYVGVPREEPARSIGMLVSFATVLPAIFETGELLHSLHVFARVRSRPLVVAPRLRTWLFVAGSASLVLPLCFPRQAFPLIWGSIALLAESRLAGRGFGGLVESLRSGRIDVVYRWLAAGLACGVLWETWNSLAAAHWIYTVPGFESAKLFEMPIAGFLGFPPFALECYSFGRLLVAWRLVPEWEDARGGGERTPHLARSVAGACAALALAWPAVRGVNELTVRATRSMVDEIPGVPKSFSATCERAGIHSTAELVAAERRRVLGAPLDALFDGMADADRRRILDAARLMEVRGLGARGIRLLSSAGITSVSELARSDAETLLERMSRGDHALAPPPTPAEVRVWVDGARLES
jgi:hypothetical protein